jgi:hypothetical protein
MSAIIFPSRERRYFFGRRFISEASSKTFLISFGEKSSTDRKSLPLIPFEAVILPLFFTGVVLSQDSAGCILPACQVK